VARPVDPRRDLRHLLLDAAAAHGGRTAFEHGAARWTYEDLAVRAARLAAEIGDRGASGGDVVAWIGDNGPWAGLAYFAAAAGGFVLAPLHLRLRDEDLRRILDHARARLVLCDAAAAPRAAALGRPVLALDGDAAAPRTSRPSDGSGAEPGPDDAAHLYYTSGSTGTPKGVVLTHRNVATHAALAIRALGLAEDDVWLHAAPMFHLADAWATFAITAVGGTHRFVPRFDARAVLDALEGGVTVTNLVPTMWSALVRDPTAASRRYPALRLLLSGGAAIAPTLVRRIRETFRCEYAQTYGLTETSPYLTISRLDPEERALPEAEQCARLSRAGRPMPGVDVRVVDAEGSVVPPDGASVGEVVARGPTVTPGYLRNPDADAAAFRDGWFRTGDLAVVHADGRVDLVDRTNDVINSGGEKVFSADVERALSDLDGLVEVAVVASPDPHWGEVVTAVVVADGPPPSLEALQAHARARLADFQVPRRMVVLDGLPRTASGKVSKREIRSSLRGR
jgi:acyl-CoA synthetase (AMP-forming)/AMP-acid ligase II